MTKREKTLWEHIKSVLRRADPKDPRVDVGYLYYALQHYMPQSGDKPPTRGELEKALSTTFAKRLSREGDTITFHGMMPRKQENMSQIIAEIIEGKRRIEDLPRSEEITERGDSVIRELIERGMTFMMGMNSINLIHTIEKETGREAIIIGFPNFNEETGIQTIDPVAEVLVGDYETLRDKFVTPFGGWSYVPTEDPQGEDAGISAMAMAPENVGDVHEQLARALGEEG